MLDLESEGTMIPGNTDNHLPHYRVYHLRQHEPSATQLSEPKTLQWKSSRTQLSLQETTMPLQLDQMEEPWAYHVLVRNKLARKLYMDI